MTTMEQMSQKSDPYTAGYDQGNVSEGNPPPYQPAHQLGAPNPYHAGYDQPTHPGMQPYNYPPQQQVIARQAWGTYPKGTDLTIPSILVCIFCCCCTGLPAIIYAARAQSTYALGQWEEAERYQRRARNLMISSIVIHFAIWILMVILYFVLIRVAMETTENAFDNFASAMETTTRFHL